MNQKNDADLWQRFLDDEEREAAKYRPVTDGSQWIGSYDRRSTPRDEESAPDTENNLNSQNR